MNEIEIKREIKQAISLLERIRKTESAMKTGDVITLEMSKIIQGSLKMMVDEIDKELTTLNYYIDKNNIF